MTLQAPFPWFGGKSRVAAEIWSRFGDVRNYVEPFFGSGAVLLARPQPFQGVETINDACGFVANFWRAVQADAAGVAQWCDWPVNETDLAARHYWLVTEGRDRLARLLGDPAGYCPQVRVPAHGSGAAMRGSARTGRASAAGARTWAHIKRSTRRELTCARGLPTCPRGCGRSVLRMATGLASPATV
jgi:hypothetical protein